MKISLKSDRGAVGGAGGGGDSEPDSDPDEEIMETPDGIRRGAEHDAFKVREVFLSGQQHIIDAEFIFIAFIACDVGKKIGRYSINQSIQQRYH